MIIGAGLGTSTLLLVIIKMDFSAAIIAILSGFTIFQIIRLLSPDNETKGTEVPQGEAYIEAKDVSKTTPIESARRLGPAEWEITLHSGQKTIVYTEGSPFDELELHTE